MGFSELARFEEDLREGRFTHRCNDCSVDSIAQDRAVHCPLCGERMKKILESEKEGL